MSPPWDMRAPEVLRVRNTSAPAGALPGSWSLAALRHGAVTVPSPFPHGREGREARETFRPSFTLSRNRGRIFAENAMPRPERRT